MRVQLIVTGDMEQHALHLSLAHVFKGAGVEFLPPQKEQDFTSNRLPPLPTGPIPVTPIARKLAARLVAAIQPAKRHEDVADLVVAVDDLELVNQDQPAVVVGHFRQAVQAHINAQPWSQSTRNRVVKELQEKASFHLLNPMSEAYFFGEQNALQRAQATLAPNLFQAHVRDLEDFEVSDQTYLGPAPEGAAWDVSPRHRHPKHYVRYLSAAPGTPEPLYRETKQGKAGLENLDWRQVTQRPSFTTFARSMLDDLADAFNLPGIQFPGALEPLTQRKGGGVLRNI